MQELFSDLRSSSGINVLTASSGMEFVFAEERPEGDNGVFTYCLINGLKTGESDTDGDGRIRISDVNQFLSESVPAMTGGRQRPTGRQLNRNGNFILGSTTPRPPFEAKTFIGNYLALTSRNGKEEELSALFADQVNYFGNVRTPDEILREETSYHRKYPQRNFVLDHREADPVQATAESDTEERVIYSISYGMTDTDQNHRAGSQTLEMKVKLEDGEWRISGLKVLKSEQGNP
jgi:hypothetical protein